MGAFFTHTSNKHDVLDNVSQGSMQKCALMCEYQLLRCTIFLTILQAAVSVEQWVAEVATGVSSDDEELGNIHLYCVL